MKKIAICGKGGSGKSVITRLLANGLQRRGNRVLVIDGDESNTSLHRMFGSGEPPETLIDLLGGIRKLEDSIVAQINAGGSEETMEVMRDVLEMPITDIPADYLFEADSGIKLVVVGKIMMALDGCACPMGIVSRSFLKKLRLESDEVAIIDLEAGVEHFGRGVETSVDAVIAVVEPSIDSLEIAERIGELSEQLQIADVWAILNKVPSEQIASELTTHLESKGMTVIGSIPQDPAIFESCLRGSILGDDVAADDVEKIVDFLCP
jgi:CO dehydrogenase maturation factor